MHSCAYLCLHAVYAYVLVCMRMLSLHRYFCLPACLPACLHACLPACLHWACMPLHMHILYVCMSVGMYACMFACMHYECMHECRDVSVNACLYVYVYIKYVFIYVHLCVAVYAFLHVISTYLHTWYIFATHTHIYCSQALNPKPLNQKP